MKANPGRDVLTENLATFERIEIPVGSRRHSAVAVTAVLDREHDSRLSFLLTLRAPRMKAHAGQWAIPGGRIDPGEDAPTAARRELNEELGLFLPDDAVLGLLDDYEAAFGRAQLATAGLAVHTDPAAARWIWERTAPLAETASRLNLLERRVLLCPIQFSIGLIAFERRFWEQIGCFAVHRHRLLAGLSTLGGDEAYLCARAVEISRPAVVTTAALAGHFSFGPQYAGLKALLDERPELFSA